MFAPKNFNLSEELINASRKVMEQKTEVVEEETELNEEEEALFEAFEAFLEENFYVDQLTEEEVEYLLDMFINEEGTDELTKAISSQTKQKEEEPGADQPGKNYKKDIKADEREGFADSTDSIIASKLKQAVPSTIAQGMPSLKDYGGTSVSKDSQGQVVRTLGVPPSVKDYGGKNVSQNSQGQVVRTLGAPSTQTTQQAKPQTRPQAPSMSARKSSSSGSSSSERFTGPKGRAGFGDSGSSFGG